MTVSECWRPACPLGLRLPIGLGPVILRCGLFIAALARRCWLLGLGDGVGVAWILRILALGTQAKILCRAYSVTPVSLKGVPDLCNRCEWCQSTLTSKLVGRAVHLPSLAVASERLLRWYQRAVICNLWWPWWRLLLGG
jgi:hypothetical protein